MSICLRWIVAFAFLLVLSVADAAERFSNGYTQSDAAFFRAGIWWNPGQSGWGLDLHMAADQMVAGWATYDEQGNSVWYLGVGRRNSSGSWDIPLLSYHWDSGVVTSNEVGSLTIRFADGYHAQMEWRLGQRSGQTLIEAFVAGEQPTAEDLTGFWHRTDQPGYGLSISTQGDKLYGVIYLYDSDGNPSWVWVDNLNSPEHELLTALRFTGTCPGCDTVARGSEPAGSAQLEFISENEGLWSIDVEAGSPGKLSRWAVSRAIVRQLTNRASGRAERYQLQPFTNPQMLREYLIDGLLGGTNYPSSAVEVLDFTPSPTAPSADTSQTNVQEAGVDEADLIQSDGRFVYAAKPADYSVEPPTKAAVRVMQLTEGRPPAMTELGSLEIGLDNERVAGLYLVKNRPEGRADLLVAVIGEPQYYYFDFWFAPWPWYESSTRLVFMDISDPANIQRTVEIELDGGNVATRLIGERLYLVTRSAVNMPSPYVDQSPAAIRADLDLNELLPRWRRDGIDQGPLVDAANVLLPPQPPGARYADMITVSAFDLADLAAVPKTQTYTGLAETVYVSPNNLYIASSRTGYGFDPARSGALPESASAAEIDIHQFELTGDGPIYRGSGAANGYLSWAAIAPAFQFSEHDGHLRVLTTVGDWLAEHQQLSILQLATDDVAKLPLRSFIPNDRHPELIGKPNELLHGVRFFGERLYAVTFKKTDPFYVIDLADPDDPFIAGELELPGFSDYLHPVSNELVLGFGQNAVPADTAGDRDFAWFQGLQLSLFDIADPSQPRLIERIDIGRRGSTSPLLRNHHALAYLGVNPAVSRPARVAIPVQVADVDDPSRVSPEPNYVYPWQYTGLAMFEVEGINSDEPSLVFRDTLVSHRRDESTMYPPVNVEDARGLIAGNRAYLYLQGAFFGSNWGQGDPMAGPL